ncbi:ribonuclease toxin immunity protein CdiI [Paenibacillus sp. PsM32]|uniref:ribonuclease toxin immunity protein CdiI n=1 Tax=Paenibacillus sp. PsM32 TaxID=3030536 RepID=UPI003F884296
MDLYYRHIENGYFLDALKNYAISTGFGLESIGCVFAEELKEWEDDYLGDTGIAYYFD